MPDAQETYMSPALLPRASELHVIFGSGGETLPGSLWRIELSRLYASDAASAQRLATGSTTGFVGPVTLADMNADGVDDIVASSFGAELKVIDGARDMPLLERSLDGGVETYVAPVVAQLTRDRVPDIWLSYDRGHFPTYSGNRHVLFDGASGEILFDRDLGTIGTCGHVAADLDGDGLDELILGSNVSRSDPSQFVVTFNAPLHLTAYWYDPRNMRVQPFAEEFLRPGMAAPLLDDLDGDGDLELVIVTSDLGKQLATWRLERFELNAGVPSGPYYGAYMGNRYDGRWDARP
jgi:hypothetical protein